MFEVELISWTAPKREVWEMGAGEVRAAHFEAALPKVHGQALPTTEGELAKRLQGLGVESE